MRTAAADGHQRLVVGWRRSFCKSGDRSYDAQDGGVRGNRIGQIAQKLVESPDTEELTSGRPRFGDAVRIEECEIARREGGRFLRVRVRFIEKS
jgi:hypothetical protein